LGQSYETHENRSQKRKVKRFYEEEEELNILKKHKFKNTNNNCVF